MRLENRMNFFCSPVRRRLNGENHVFCRSIFSFAFFQSKNVSFNFHNNVMDGGDEFGDSPRRSARVIDNLQLRT